VTYAPGTRVRARPGDPDHHTRVPGYVRGQVGEVVEAQGEWPLPDDRARGIRLPRVETVYAVRFPARDLWGDGSHTVTVDLWESYLEEVPS
jgi:nitrile hydratase subunit beta